MCRIYILLIALFAFACSRNGLDELDSVCKSGSCNIAKPVDTYDYPIKPGDPIWATFTSGEERFNALQIPQQILEDISTEGLIQTCIDFPAMGNLALHVGVNVPLAVQGFMTRFTGMVELAKRSDSGEKMLERYSMMYPACVYNHDPQSVNVSFTLDFSAFEMIIGYDDIIKNMGLASKRKLVRLALENYRCKRTLPKHNGLYSISSSLYIPAKIMLQEEYGPFLDEVEQNAWLELFTEKLLWPNTNEGIEAMFTSIVNHGENFIGD